MNRLSNDLLLDIMDLLDPPRRFASIKDVAHGPPALKSFSLCSRRLHALCRRKLYSSIRLFLRQGAASRLIDHVVNALSSQGIIPDRMAICFGRDWNEGGVAMELRKLLCELQVKSLSLHQSCCNESIAEEHDDWPYALEHISSLRIEMQNGSGNIEMLLRPKCSARYLEIDDLSGNPETDDFSRYARPVAPKLLGAAVLNPAMFPHLERMSYIVSPRPNCHLHPMHFVDRLPLLHRLVLEIELTRHKRECVSGREWTYMGIRKAYDGFAREADFMEGPAMLVIRDVGGWWDDDWSWPSTSMVETDTRVYRKINPACDGKQPYLPIGDEK
ncbi:hypothetical protein BZA05DRAFT_395102 [Tricharina praecox]|uniref:uncharacterized protein n=1 Tax=Tricharina praecox TaxID=43433 RepID=UPI00221EC01A|nr:uncharacterized protein BZA05DRAFT_395102 [Tricharina praecox]KAI5853924.1 hypothetical protein BZA05DRAFT_395102 [Tricharina praecox]